MQSKNTAAIWFTGLSGSGKSTLATTLGEYLSANGSRNIILDGDIIRQGLCNNLGFSKEDREENCRRIAEAARLMLLAEVTTLIPVISPYRATREKIKNLFEPGRYIEVYVRCPLEICEARDPKGLYRKARAGEIPHFTGISDPYEEPLSPDICIDTGELNHEDAFRQLLNDLALHNFPMLYTSSL